MCLLRDEADIIITNPPFSLFRAFIDWIFEKEKDFIIVGNDNNVSYKDVFTRFINNEIWKGINHIKDFITPDGSMKTFGNVSWFTNIDHGRRRRHEPLRLMTMEDNLRFNKPLIKALERKYNCREYPMLDNYNAIEVPVFKGIPSDYIKNCQMLCKTHNRAKGNR